MREDLAAIRDSIAKLTAKGESRSSRSRRWLRVALWAAAVLIVARIAQLAFSDAVVIEAISIPKSLAEVGYTPEVAAARLESAIADVYAAAKTSKDFPAVAVRTNDVLEAVEVPQAKLSVRTLVELVRYLIGVRPTTVHGTIVQEGENLRMLIRVRSKGETVPATHSFSAPAGDVGALFSEAAHFTLRKLDTYIEARYLVTVERRDLAILLARHGIHSRQCNDPCRSMLFHLWGNILSERRENVEAIEKFRQAIAHDPKNRLTRLSWSNVLLSQGDYRGAREQLQVLLDRDHRDARAVGQLGWIERLEKNTAAAETQFRRAAELDPSDRLLEQALGVFYYETNRIAEGAEHFRNAKAIDPDASDTYVLWARELFSLGDHTGATKFAARALSLSPHDPDVHALLADIVYDKKDKARAAALLPDLKANTGESADAFLALARLYQLLGRGDDALTAAEKATDLCPRCAGIWRSRALLLDLYDRGPEADQAFRRAVAADPGDERTYVVWGRFLQRQGRIANAEAQYEAALRRDPRSATAYRGLADCAKARGDSTRAAEMTRKAEDLEKVANR